MDSRTEVYNAAERLRRAEHHLRTAREELSIVAAEAPSDISAPVVKFITRITSLLSEVDPVRQRAQHFRN